MKKFIKGFGFALKGLIYTFCTQLNFKFHLFAGLFAVVLGIYVKLSYSDWLWISISIALVLITELFNTAIEVLVNLVSPEYNPQAGIIKDVSAAAVLLAAIFSVLVGLLIFIPKFLN